VGAAEARSGIAAIGKSIGGRGFAELKNQAVNCSFNDQER
jgi:hypothetical protein